MVILAIQLPPNRPPSSEPCDASVNSAKSNRDFDEASTAYTDASPPSDTLVTQAAIQMMTFGSHGKWTKVTCPA
jgi:hypothetical protein